MQPGSSVDLSLRVTASNGAFGLSSIIITVNSPPSGGSLLLSQTSGIAGETTFRFDAADWKDPNQPISYGFYVQSGSSSGNTPTVIQENSVTSFAEVVLPTGDPSKNYSLTVIMTVTDALGASVNVTGNVVVVAPPAVTAGEDSKLNYVQGVVNTDLVNMVGAVNVDQAR